MAINPKFLPLLFKKQTNLVRSPFDEICKSDRPPHIVKNLKLRSSYCHSNLKQRSHLEGKN